MNLFCFSLEGSTESIYEPPYSQILSEVLPKYQCSPVLQSCNPEWGGSEPFITSGCTQNTIQVIRSCDLASPLVNETFDKDIHYACWMSSGVEKDQSHPMKEMYEAPLQSSMLSGDDRVKQMNAYGTQKHLPPQGDQTAADIAESIHTTGRLKNLWNLVQMKTGHQSGAGRGQRTSENNDVLSNNNPVLSCISLGKRSERMPSSIAPLPQQQQQHARDVREDPKAEGIESPQVGNNLWNPFDCPQPWAPIYHTCHQPRHELCGGTFSLPRTMEWDHFESLIQELDSKQSDVSPAQMIRSITDLQLSHHTLTRLGRFDNFRQLLPLKRQRDYGSTLQKQEQKNCPTTLRLQRRETETPSHGERKHISFSSEKTAITTGNTPKDEAEKREDGGQSFRKGHRWSGNSLESLYSLNSRQSSSSKHPQAQSQVYSSHHNSMDYAILAVHSGGVQSCSSNSLRLDDNILYTGQFCGRAKVHTDFVPSPYDTESLKLKVGDVIDIMAKPPMGIWTGMLNGRIGHFKFIYVDEITEESSDKHKETHIHRVRQKSTVQEVLEHLSMEEHFSFLQPNDYQIAEDLMRMREHYLTEPNVTDPEHRHHLLTTVESLQQLRCSSQLESESNQESMTPSENIKTDMNNCPQDSGRHMPCDSPTNSTEDTHLQFISEYPVP